MKAVKLILFIFLGISSNAYAVDAYRAKIAKISTQPNDQAYIVLGGTIVAEPNSAPLSCFYGIIYLAPKGNLPSSKAMLSLAMTLYASQSPMYVVVKNNTINGGQDCEATQLVAE